MLIAEVVPATIGRVVGVAHSIYIVSLHQLYILEHDLHSLCATRLWVLVTIGTLDDYGLSIDAQLSIFNLRHSKSHLATCYLGKLSIATHKFQYKRVEVWVLGTPRLNLSEFHLFQAAFVVAQVARIDTLAIFVKKREVDRWTILLASQLNI